MFKKSKSISINILSVFIILVCLLLSCVGFTNAWFTSESQNGVKIIVEIGTLKLNLYQNIEGTNTQILTNQDNLTSTSPQYVVLNEVIGPDEEIELVLTLANEDTGSASMYLRYKFEIYARGTNSDTLIVSTIDGYSKQSSTQKGFVFNEDDGYYYYKDTSGENTLFQKGTTERIMESFTIPYNSFINDDATLKLVNSETIYIKLTVDASSSKTFNS